jgi:hypothetical protein
VSLEQIEISLTPLKAPKKTVVTLDIERLPGRFEADFWDLNAFKGRRIHPEMVTEWPRTICVAWAWYGDTKTEFASEWTDGREAMLRRVWDVVDRADIIYGHNVARFDMRKLNSDWRDLGMPPPSPCKPVDTLTEARKVFGDESFTLAALTKRVGVDTKTDKYTVEMARAAVAGDKAAQRQLKAYNIGDIAASRAFVDRLRGWIPSHPHNLMGTINDRPTCNQCWGDNLERNGTKLAQQIAYVLYRCRDCGANVQGTRHARAAVTRGAR